MWKTFQKEYLSAPKSRRVRSNSPSLLKSITKSKSNYGSTNKNRSTDDKSNNSHKSHNNLLTINHAHSDRGSMRSSESTNSTFSAGFLPSPDMNSPSATSSMTTFGTSANQNNASFGVVAMVAAAIGSSLFLTDEQHEKLIAQQQSSFKDQKKQFPNRLSSSVKNNFFSNLASSITNSNMANTASNSLKKLKTSASLMPVKITVQNETGSITSQTSSVCNSKNNSTTNVDQAVVRTRETRLESVISNKQRTSFAVNELTVANTNNSSNSSSSKPGSEVLTLISTWIKNAPNDFMGLHQFYSFLLFLNNKYLS